MKLVKLSEYFEISSGIEKSKISYSDIKLNENYIPYTIPSNQYNGTFCGFVDKNSCNKNKIYPVQTIFYGNTGEGCHTFAYVSQSEFVPNNNVSVLIPKLNLILEEKLFYAQCVTNNRYKFCYGRIPKQNRITNLLIPAKESIPAFVYKQKIRTVSNKPLNEGKIELDVRGWKSFKLYPDIFTMVAGKYYPADSYENGKTPLISASESDNGMSSMTNLKAQFHNCLTVGKIGISTYYQSIPFVASPDVTVLSPNNSSFNQYVGLFIATLINKEKYKWSYGRQIRLNDCQKLEIKLPATPQGEPDWQFMENYIKSLPFSSSL